MLIQLKYMKKRFGILFIIAFSLAAKAQDPVPKVVQGSIERIENFQSEYVTSRNVDVWLPEGYSTAKKYPVLYMQDGQMLFDAESSWNKQAWDLDDVASNLFALKRIEEFIVVGIWNGGTTRHRDYYPQKCFESLTKKEQDTITAQLLRASIAIEGSFEPRSDLYLKFLVEELKPYIEKNYSVLTNRENTYLAGSSMGGLISIYALCEYPELFGGAACLSTHWLGTFTPENNPAPDSFLAYLRNNLPGPEDHRIYFDCGDQTLDQYYPEIQKKVDEIMHAKGFDNTNWTTRYFPGEDHSENAWNKRLNYPLEFLFAIQ
jgi:enterochelin esterase-like enzyme